MTRLTSAATDDLHLEIFQLLQSKFQRQPADAKGQQHKAGDAFRRPAGARVQTGRTEHQQQHRRQDVKRTQNEAQGAAEAADNFVRVGLLQVRIQHPQSNGETVERKRHDRDHRAKKQHAVPGCFEQIAGQQ